MTDHPPLRTLPEWHWTVATLFFPFGLFIVYGWVGLLPWRRAVLLAVLSYASIAGLAQLMAYFARGDVHGVIPNLIVIGGLVMLCGWGVLLYHIGQRRAYWSPEAQINWGNAARLAAVVVTLVCLLVLSFLL